MKFSAYVKSFFRKGVPGLLNELGDTLKDRFATDNDRMRAIEILSLFPEKHAVPQLLKRFDLLADNTLRDAKEKNMVAKMLVGEGPSILKGVIEYARHARHLSWPIAIMAQLTSRKEYVSILLGILSTTYPPFEEDVVKRNREILVGLQDIEDERIPAYVEPHLSCRYPEIQEAARACLEPHRRTPDVIDV